MSYTQGVRQMLEEREESLSPNAQKSRSSRGRREPEEKSPVRTEFQRDRDRILHCKSFRRLKHKTQVFIAPAGDHYRTRLTHTLEVSQIARTIARALNLNEDLTEAISLGHDLGHTPFGHVGEEVLAEIHPEGFHHNEQSLRVVELLENGGKGLNLTWEVRDGILHHSKSRASVMDSDWGTAGTFEGDIVKMADMVAYINHDIDDSIRSGVINISDLPTAAVKELGDSHSVRINTMVCDVIDYSAAVSGRDPIQSSDKPSIGMSPRVRDATDIMRSFLFERVYKQQSRLEVSIQARELLRRLFAYYIENIGELPTEYRIHGKDKQRMVMDYISGMTDLYAEQTGQKLSLLDGKIRS